MTGGFVVAFVLCLVLAFLLAATEAALQRVTRGGAQELADDIGDLCDTQNLPKVAA